MKPNIAGITLNITKQAQAAFIILTIIYVIAIPNSNYFAYENFGFNLVFAGLYSVAGILFIKCSGKLNI